MTLIEISEASVRNMRPSVLAPGKEMNQIDDIVARSLSDDFLGIRGLLPEEYSISRIGSAIYYRLPWLISSGRDFSQLNALELGCGRGLKAIPWSRIFRSYIGVDLDKDAISFARKAAKETQKENLNFYAGNASDVVKNPRLFGVDGKVDVVIAYASLEHMTPVERKEVLGLSREVLQDGGALIVSETPNRLIPHDGHSTFLHFFQSLPTEIALEYVKRSPREWAVKYTEAGEEALYRFGQGLSYHEFDLWLSGGEKLPGIITDGWSPWALSDEPPRRDELWLNDYLDANGSLAPPAFGRYWIDAVFDGLAEEAATPEVPRLIPPREISFADRKYWTLDIGVYDFPDAMHLEPNGTCSILIDLNLSRGAIAVEHRGGHLCTVEIDTVKSARLPKWHTWCAIDLSAFGHINEISLRPADHVSRLVSAGILVRCQASNSHPGSTAVAPASVGHPPDNEG